MLYKDYINKIKKNKLDYLSLLLALVATYAIFKEQYVFSFILAISSIGLFQYNYYQDSKKIKEQLLRNQKEEIKKKVKNINVKPNQFGQVGDTLSKLIIIFLLIVFFSQYFNEYIISEPEIKKSLNIISAAKIPPYILIENRTVNIVFLKIDGSLGHWTVPFSSLESDIKRGYFKREFIDEYITPFSANLYDSYEDVFLGCSNSLIQMCNEYQVLYSTCGGSGSIGCNDLKDTLQDSYNGFIEGGQSSILEISQEGKNYITLIDSKSNKEVTVMDFRSFIDSEPFTNVIGTLYQESESDDEFIREVWNIVTQLNIYSTEIEETPRYPLETFLAGGGDGEDSSILFASMIKSAPINWEVQLVYMDADNPENPQEVNHVLVFIDTGKEKYFIETTNNQEMQPYDYIDGWYLEI